MRIRQLLFACGLVAGLAPIGHATCTSLSDPCNAPRNPTFGTITATKIPITVQNSAIPNTTNSIYFFQATTLGTPQVGSTPDLNTVIVFTADFTSPALPTDLISINITPLLAGTNYNTYAMACPPGTTAPEDDGCSAWVATGVRTTGNLTNAGFNNIAAADTEPQQFIARTNASVVDQDNVTAWLTSQLTSTEVGVCGLTRNLQPFPDSGAASMTITSADCATLLPNRPYRLTENFVYQPTQQAPSFQTGVFYTRAATPLAVSVTNVTHCSATLNYQNAVSNPANPSDTSYTINVGGPVSSGSASQNKVIGGTGQASDPNSVTFTNLQAGTAYNSTVIANNRGGGSWRASQSSAFGSFQTVAWGGTFSVPPASIGTTSADFVANGVNTAGVQSWQIETTPAVAGLPSGNAADLNGTHTMANLVPNTQYTVRIRITEASGCFSVLPVTPIAFTTTPNVPSTFNLVAPAPRQLTATWNANGNPAATIYQIQYCTDAAFTQNCRTQNTAAGVTNATLTTGVVPETTYHAHVRALTIGGGQNSNYSEAASATTPNEVPSITSMSCAVPVGNTTTCTAQATDNGLPGTALLCHWTVNNGAAITSGNDQPTNASGACPQVALSFPGNGTYRVTLEVQDHAGVAPYLTDTDFRDVIVGPQPAKITIVPSSATVLTNNTQLFTAIVCDQFETGTCDNQSQHIMPNQPVTWILGGGGSLSASNGASTTYTAPVTPGAATLTARLSPAPDAVAPITIIPSGFTVETQPSFTVNADGVTGSATVSLRYNSVLNPPNVIYSWSVVQGPGAVNFSPNGTNSARNTTLTFTKRGDYLLRVTFNVGADSASAETAVGNVPPILKRLDVSPSEATIKAGEVLNFTALGVDQFGDNMPLSQPVTWTQTQGNLDASGANASFTSGSMANGIQIVATSEGISGYALVNAISYDVSGAKAYPTPYKANNPAHGSTICFEGLGSSAKLRIFTPSGVEVFSRSDIVGNDSPTCDFPWDMKNSSGERLASGVYLYIIESPDAKKEGKLIIIR